MKSIVTIGVFDLTTRHDLIMYLVGLSVDCIVFVMFTKPLSFSLDYRVVFTLDMTASSLSHTLSVWFLHYSTNIISK